MSKSTYTDVEVKAGVFLAFCLALFVGMLMLFGKIPRLWRERQEVHAIFSSVAALKPGAVVLFNGVDVGRVRSMQILHMDRTALAHLTTLTRSDLDFLPLSDVQCKKLRLVPDYEFDAQVKDALLDKTMIHLTLEVLQEGQFKRYRLDDAICISATLLGDTSIEIISGSGRPLDPSNPVLLLGHSGDFFAKLSRSMDQVKEVLSTMTDVVGTEERSSFKRAAGRLSHVLDGVDRMGTLASKRAEASAQKLDGLDESASKNLNAFGQLFQRALPDSKRLFSRMGAARTDLEKRYSDVLTEMDQAAAEVKALVRGVTDDIRVSYDAAAPDIEQMQAHFRVLSTRADRLTAKLDSLYYRSGRLYEQSLPEFTRAVAALKSGFKPLSGLKQYMLENLGKIMGKGDKGEHEYYTALETFRSLTRSARGPRYASTELGELQTLVHNPGTPDQGVTQAQIEATLVRLLQVQVGLDVLRNAAAEALLPPFTGNAKNGSVGPFRRKRAGRAVYPVK